ncbi:MAG: hypothetical protein H6Q72_929 [Firmicutes bacterium]|nr:hypothetical protein [Bacillota bacterium]
MKCDICGRPSDKVERFRDCDWCPECKSDYDRARKLVARDAMITIIKRMERRQYVMSQKASNA